MILAFVAGCDRDQNEPATQPASNEVVIYTSVDEPVARMILDDFSKETGIKVTLRTDAEASKTAGLVARLRAEKNNPQADVFWNNEIFHTVNLANEGVLAPYESPAAKDVLAHFKDPQHRWAGSAARIRVIATNGIGRECTGLEDLAASKFKGRVGMANPAFGTTSGHMAALFVSWGEERYVNWLKALKGNDIKLLGGNSEVVRQAGAGNIFVGLTDNDDIDMGKREGLDVSWILAAPQGGEGLGIPCTAGLVAGAKRPEAAKKAIDYLLSERVERRLIEMKFAIMSTRSQVTRPHFPLMKLDYAEAAKGMPRAVELAREILEGRE